jgi:hypothetical protein
MATKPVKTADQGRAKAKVTDNERLSDLFQQAFLKASQDRNSEFTVDEFECSAEKSVDGKDIKVEVRVFGNAVTSSQDQMYQKNKQGKLLKIAKGAEKIKVTLDNDSVAVFALADCLNLNATDYLLAYKME